MKNILNHSVPYERFFEEMTRIPHGSFHEELYSAYLVDFAKTHDLPYKQYDIGNVIIYKAGSKGYENHEPVILQAHMDMVCEKESWSDHDFSKDPLELYIEDGWLKAKGTTLGADDGAGVAYILAVLEDDTLCHPPLECVFTVQEETGMGGAFEIRKEDLSARRFISLDDGGGGEETYISSAGGTTISMSRTYPLSPVSDPAFRLTVSGLAGGHSGEYISEERGNAVKYAFRLLDRLSAAFKIRLVSADGGSKGNALPRDCAVVFHAAASLEELQGAISGLCDDIKKEQDSTGSIPVFSLAPASEKIPLPSALSYGDTLELIRLVMVLPNGMRHKSMSIPGLTTASENMAILKLDNGFLRITATLRSMLDSHLDLMKRELEILSGLFGLSLQADAYYPGWPFMEHSPLRDLLSEIALEVNHRELKPLAVHGGLECGFFSKLLPGVDIVTLGPKGLDVHTPQERLSMESFRTTWEIFVRLLARL